MCSFEPRTEFTGQKLCLLHRLILASSDFKLQLVGEIKQDIGPDPQLYVSLYLNGRRGGTIPQLLCADSLCVIVQNGIELSEGQVPTKGKVMMSYKNMLRSPWLLKGWYTLRIEMYAGRAAGKARMTGFGG